MSGVNIYYLEVNDQVFRVMEYFIGARGQRNPLALFEWDFEQLNNLAAAMILEPIQFV